MDGRGHALVAGAGVVYFVDAAHATLNTASHVHSGQPISVGSLHVMVLSAGQEYDLRSRKLLTAEARAGTAEARTLTSK